ncbi:MAG: NYN domain-containing protein [Candidatus Doudnabacteria bacterium]|nr:NYN domain-containing protein [Candidatus Doudnabacteria bacterium]
MTPKSKQSPQRVGVFVDTQNLFYAAKYQYKARVHFGNILKDVVGERQLVRAIAYGIKSEEGDEQSFFEALEKQGFDVKVKPLQIFYGGAKKGDWDIGIAMDIMRLASKLDVVILLSGDGDFVDLLEHAVSLGCRVEVASFGTSSSHRLREVADDYYDLDGNDNYLMQKGRVRVSARRQAPSGAGMRAVESRMNADDVRETSTRTDSVTATSDGRTVETLEPGIEIVHKAKPVATTTSRTSAGSSVSESKKSVSARKPGTARRATTSKAVTRKAATKKNSTKKK